MRLAIVLALMTGVLLAANTTVSQSGVTAGNGSLATGTITICPQTPFTALDSSYVSACVNVSVTNGAFSASLEPTDTAITPYAAYTVKWQLNGARPETQLWAVPTSGTPLVVNDVNVSGTPPYNYQVGSAQIAQSGASTGQLLAWSGTAWLPVTFSGSSGPNVVGSSNVTGVAASQATVTLGSALAARHYAVRYYADLSTPCTAGSAAVSFQFGWADASAARSLVTGSLLLGTSNGTQNYLSGLFELYSGSGNNVTYSSTVAGGCLTGTATYDVHVTLELIQ